MPAPQLQALQQQVDSLQAEVQFLRQAMTRKVDGKTAEAAVTESLLRDVLADADERSSLLAASETAGWDNGFFLASGDGNNRLRVHGLLTIRWLASLQQGAPDDNFRSGFELARTRFGFSGHVIDPSWQFMIWTGHGPSGQAALLDVWARKTFGEGFAVRAGQFKLPFWREWLGSEASLQVIERSLLNSFSGGYTQGVELQYAGEHVKAVASVNDGLGGANGLWMAEDVEYAVTGRVDLKLLGVWSDAGDFQGWADLAGPVLVIGAAAHFQETEFTKTRPETSTLRWTADAMFKGQGFSLFAAVVGNQGWGGGDPSFDQIGALLQGGVFLTERVELVGRYEFGQSISGDDLSVATAGVNWFLHRHRARVSFDLGYAFNGIGAEWAGAVAMTGWREDQGDGRGQVVGRVQLQLAF